MLGNTDKIQPASDSSTPRTSGNYKNPSSSHPTPQIGEHFQNVCFPQLAARLLLSFVSSDGYQGPAEFSGLPGGGGGTFLSSLVAKFEVARE